jgi:hypothetical protein
MNVGLERISKEVIVVWWTYCRGVCLEGLRKTSKHLTLAGVPPEIRAHLLPNKNLERYHHTRSRDSVVGIETSYGLDDRGVGVRVPVGSRISSPPNRRDRL